jgi:Na+-translocating ferredoxin:NAD+ oxidoreductase RnfG subunit
MNDFSNPAIIAAFVAAGAAVLTALVSALFNLSIARKVASQKLAEMRQIWIEDLRGRMADFLGCTHRILNQRSPNKEKISQELRELNAELVRLEEYISKKKLLDDWLKSLPASEAQLL